MTIGLSYEDLKECPDARAALAPLMEKGSVTVHIDRPQSVESGHQEINAYFDALRLDVGLFYGTERDCKKVACDKWAELKNGKFTINDGPQKAVG